MCKFKYILPKMIVLTLLSLFREISILILIFIFISQTAMSSLVGINIE